MTVLPPVLVVNLAEGSICGNGQPPEPTPKPDRPDTSNGTWNDPGMENTCS
ncbi:MAG: hypothetical protein ACYC0F_10280 [Rhodanobacter sp.]